MSCNVFIEKVLLTLTRGNRYLQEIHSQKKDMVTILALDHTCPGQAIMEYK